MKVTVGSAGALDVGSCGELWGGPPRGPAKAAGRGQGVSQAGAALQVGCSLGGGGPSLSSRRPGQAEGRGQEQGRRSPTAGVPLHADLLCARGWGAYPSAHAPPRSMPRRAQSARPLGGAGDAVAVACLCLARLHVRPSPGSGLWQPLPQAAGAVTGGSPGRCSAKPRPPHRPVDAEPAAPGGVVSQFPSGSETESARGPRPGWARRGRGHGPGRGWWSGGRGAGGREAGAWGRGSWGPSLCPPRPGPGGTGGWTEPLQLSPCFTQRLPQGAEATFVPRASAARPLQQGGGRAVPSRGAGGLRLASSPGPAGGPMHSPA